jgi:hypothetical protein
VREQRYGLAQLSGRLLRALRLEGVRLALAARQGDAVVPERRREIAADAGREVERADLALGRLEALAGL